MDDVRHRAAGLRAQLRSEGRARVGERGAAAVEFAIVVGLLLTIVFGTIDFGLYFNAATIVNNAAREGVRAASFNQSSSNVITTAKSALVSLPGYDATKATVTVTCTSATGGTCTLATSDASGGTVTVTVSYPHEWLTPIMPSGSTTLTKTSQMRVE